MESEPLVSNTSPLINLARIGYLDLLPALYAKLLIPPAVHEEITARGESRPGAREVISASWLSVHPVQNREQVRTLLRFLGPGEAEAIALCVQLRLNTLLLDERKARRLAVGLGLRPIGLLAVLVEARHRKLVVCIRPILDSLVDDAGFRVSRELYRAVLAAAGELDE